MTHDAPLPDSTVISLDEQRTQVLEAASHAMAEFQRAFASPLSASNLAVVFVAERLRLDVAVPVNNKGFDALDPRTGDRYEVKYRADGVQQVDLNNIEFDFLVLVNLGPDYHLSGIWQITQAQARQIFTPREYRGISKFQCNQGRFKAVALRLP